MSVHFIAYPVVAGMGLRESINAMLSHVAWDQSMGYDAPPVHRANYQGIARDYAAIMTPVCEHHTSTLELSPIVSDSALLADLVNTLEVLCNDYPSYDDELVSEIERDDLIEYLSGCETPDGIAPEDIAYALFEAGANTLDTDGSAYVSEDDFSAAVDTLQAAS